MLAQKDRSLGVQCAWVEWIQLNKSRVQQSVVNTYLHTPWSRVLLEKLTCLQLVKKFPAFYGTRRFITAFTGARQISLSCASSIQSTPPHPTSLRSILILSSIYFWVSQVICFLQASPPKPCIECCQYCNETKWVQMEGIF